ncbi:MAG: kinase [Acidobacteria bacterium]|nr:MAG: kinase [Acidobacteriota bacterium]
MFDASASSKRGERPQAEYHCGGESQVQLLTFGADLRAKTGYGTALAHHGEIFQGVAVCKSGRLHRGLVSLPCAIFKTDATFIPDITGVIRVDPAWKVKALRGVQLALDHKKRPRHGGLLQLSSSIPVGWGLGSSTSDVIAAIRAVGDAFDESFTAGEIATLAVKAEAASDSIMFVGSTVLFAHREGIVIEDLGEPVPDLEVLGFNTFSPARYSWWEIEAFRPLIGLLRRAIRTRDALLIGQVASASAEINQRFLPKPHFETLKTVVRSTGAVGFQVAHSGTIAGLLFDSGSSGLEVRIQQARTMLAGIGVNQTWRFHTGQN